MKHVLSSLCLLGSLLHALTRCTVPASEFHLEGDYLIGGIFNIHQVNGTSIHNRPESIDCSSHDFILSNYRRFQLMRFSVEQINNSTNLLPNVSLGYVVVDHCSDTQSFPGILELISINNEIQPWDELHENRSRVIGVIGAFQSTQTRTVAPLFMMHFIPMVSYGAASSVFSRKLKFPSFLRTVRPNQDIVEVVVKIMQHFNWRWVAFLYNDDDYGKDVFDLFRKMIKPTEICLPYSKGLNSYTNYPTLFSQIKALKINVIIVFAVEWVAEALIDSAIQLNVTNRVWIAGDAWSLNKKLPKKKGIKNIGTVIGLSERIIPIPGFSDFIHSLKAQTHCKNVGQKMFCDHICSCSAEEILAAEQSFSFTVYSAVYSIAHALHKALQCGADGCNGNITVNSTMVLAELKKSDFTLLNQSITFDENGDPRFGSYNIVFWNRSGDVEEIGSYNFAPSFHFFINSTKIQWYTNGQVPTSVCSPECPEGYKRQQEGSHICCFSCTICLNGTYINTTEDRYNCIDCKDTEWSANGSTSCNLRLVEFIPFTDRGAILIMFGAGAFVGLTLAVSVLFAFNYNTPVVRSAGGPMCFLILGCLSLCSISVFFNFGQPSVASCVLRFLPFFLFSTVCLACFVVRSFQIVCIFKIATRFPKIQGWWIKYHAQWLIITVAFVTQVLLLAVGYSSAPPTPYNETMEYQHKIVLNCDYNLIRNYGSSILLSMLISLCFIFSYMGKDLPKNYNEAKAITFCLLLLIITWIIFVTAYMLYRGKYIQTLNAIAVLSSLYFFLLWYFLPKCYIIVFQPHKNTQQYFQGLIQSYTKTIGQ